MERKKASDFDPSCSVSSTNTFTAASTGASFWMGDSFAIDSPIAILLVGSTIMSTKLSTQEGVLTKLIFAVVCCANL
ncbi:MAG: hypothetical protein HYY82_18120 [Deltaproteobacteria bacterium]|nr:hypothetical protein [Deltaproteobacteria bacterium]